MSPLKKARAKAWEAFSRFIRLRDCLETTGSPEFGKCVTCGNVFPFEELHAGHYMAGRHNAAMFDEENTHAQCEWCNCGKDGARSRYTTFMVKRYGEEKVDSLKFMRHLTIKMTVADYKDIQTEYRNRYKELIDDCGRDVV